MKVDITLLDQSYHTLTSDQSYHTLSDKVFSVCEQCYKVSLTTQSDKVDFSQLEADITSV